MNSGESHPKTIQPQVDPLPYIFFLLLCVLLWGLNHPHGHTPPAASWPQNCFRVSQTDRDVLERALHLPSALPLATSSANNPSQHGPCCLKSGNMLSVSLILITEALRIKRAKEKKQKQTAATLALLTVCCVGLLSFFLTTASANFLNHSQEIWLSRVRRPNPPSHSCGPPASVTSEWWETAAPWLCFPMEVHSAGTTNSPCWCSETGGWGCVGLRWGVN